MSVFYITGVKRVWLAESVTEMYQERKNFKKIHMIQSVW